MSLADQMLAAGCISQLDAIHGEPITILHGADVGKVFVGVVELEEDLVLETSLGEDRRGHAIVRFNMANPIPRLKAEGRIKTADGKLWQVIVDTKRDYLSNDFEIREIAKKDT